MAIGRPAGGSLAEALGSRLDFAPARTTQSSHTHLSRSTQRVPCLSPSGRPAGGRRIEARSDLSLQFLPTCDERGHEGGLLWCRMALSGIQEYLRPQDFADEASYVEYLDDKYEEYQNCLLQEYIAEEEAAWRKRVNLAVLKFATKAIAMAGRARERANAPGGAAAEAAIARNCELAKRL